MKRLFLVAMLAMTAPAHAQRVDLPQRIEPGNSESARRADPQETPMLVDLQTGNTFREWYGKQKRPPVVLYIDRQLDQMPAGWQGMSRVQIEDVSKFGKEEDSRTITMGVQHNSAVQKRLKSEFTKLFEQSLSLALKKQDVRMLDGVYLHRKLAADKRSAGSDIEFDSLNKAARFVLEVELLFIDGQCDVVASLKEIATGEIIATVRQPVESLHSGNEMDRVNKILVQHLMQFKIG